MRSTVSGLARTSAGKLLRYSGIPSAVRAATRRRPLILTYHDPAPEVLDEHLRFMGERYRFGTLDEVVDALLAGRLSALPDHTLVVTIDDGHRGNHALLPVFRRHEVRPTIYLCSQVVGTDRRFWFNDAGDAAGRLKRLSHRERLAAHERETGYRPEADGGGAPREALSHDEIREMSPWVDFGSHTRFHPILVQCDDAEARREIVDSRLEVEALLGRPCRHFAYPNGDYGDREAALAREAGYASARTTDLGWVTERSDPFRLRAFGAADDASLDVLAAQVNGVSTYLRRLAQGEVRGRWRTTPRADTVTDEAS